MSTRIAGCGWVTPLGLGLEEVWQKLLAGEVAEEKTLTGPPGSRPHRYYPVPQALVAAAGRHPRLRRASPISYYAVVAGLAALEQAGLPSGQGIAPGRLAVIFAASSGSVLYTRKFYENIAQGGLASPLLFPETVYNAPASHLAAHLGIDGPTYTLVGDSSIGLAALALGEQLLLLGEADACLVVGAEELDWVLCEAYVTWRIAARSAAGIPYTEPARGARLSEAGAAVVLTRGEGRLQLEAVHPGVAYFARREAEGALRQVVRDLAAVGPCQCVIGSANGGAWDAAEARVLARALPGVPVYAPKGALGEALGASALLQVVVAAQALTTGTLPGQPALENVELALVVSTGLNQQASGALFRTSAPLSRSSRRLNTEA